MLTFFKKLFNIFKILSVFAVILCFLVSCKDAPKQSTKYSLKAYKNTVALFENEKPVKVYENIVLNTLPEKDIQNFDKGISVATQAQAETILEDYE